MAFLEVTNTAAKHAMFWLMYTFRTQEWRANLPGLLTLIRIVSVHLGYWHKNMEEYVDIVLPLCNFPVNAEDDAPELPPI